MFENDFVGWGVQGATCFHSKMQDVSNGYYRLTTAWLGVGKSLENKLEKSFITKSIFWLLH
jgi:hypothetical protein